MSVDHGLELVRCGQEPSAGVRPNVAGLVLAAGAGSRMGMPKAMLRDPVGTPLTRTIEAALSDGGCTSTTIVIGAAAPDVIDFLGATRGQVVVAGDWDRGLSASLRRGLGALRRTEAVAALVMLADLPDASADLMRRFVERAAPDSLARATFHGTPGHPVLIGREHWDEIVRGTGGDRGANGYLRRNRAEAVPCTDLATGRDVDYPTDLSMPPSTTATERYP